MKKPTKAELERAIRRAVRIFDEEGNYTEGPRVLRRVFRRLYGRYCHLCRARKCRARTRHYWPNPPRRHIIAWAARRWPADAATFRRWPLRRLHAMWHRVNNSST